MSINETECHAPFSLDQVRSFNQCQQDGRIVGLLCQNCKTGRMYASEDNLKCPECYDTVSRCPVAMTNWAWTKFKYPANKE
jgi:hypothetical protein